MMKYLRNYNESKNRIRYKTVKVDDFTVFYGKDAESNDYVTLELSDEDDYWFHAKGVPGSHVLLKVKDKLPTDDVIKKVAEIAVKNSKSKNESGVNVVYCKKKYVRKEKGAVAGKVVVDYTNAYDILISKN